MSILNTILKNDNGSSEEISIRIGAGQDWRICFNYLIEVHCRTSEVELFPVSITSPFETLYATYNADAMEMVWVDDE